MRPAGGDLYTRRQACALAWASAFGLVAKSAWADAVDLAPADASAYLDMVDPSYTELVRSCEDGLAKAREGYALAEQAHGALEGRIASLQGNLLEIGEEMESLEGAAAFDFDGWGSGISGAVEAEFVREAAQRRTRSRLAALAEVRRGGSGELALLEESAERAAASLEAAACELERCEEALGRARSSVEGEAQRMAMEDQAARAREAAEQPAPPAAAPRQVGWDGDREGFVAHWGARIDAYLAGFPLEGHGATFAAAAWDYGIDPRWSPAISCIESTKGKYCFLPHNAWGWGSSSWPDWDSAIYAHVEGLAIGYGPTFEYSDALKYCPPTADSWYAGVCSEMELI